MARQQQARSVVTRESLLEATLQVIYAQGYLGATTKEIAKAAGVSRGALLHHFPTRTDIILASMVHLLDGASLDIRNVAKRVRQREIAIDGFIDYLWSMFTGRFFYVSLEVLTQARTDELFRSQMIPILENFNDELDIIWDEFYDSKDFSSHGAQIVLNMTLCMLRGMGVQKVLRPGNGYYDDIRAVWTSLLTEILYGKGTAAFAVNSALKSRGPADPQQGPH